MHRTFPRLLLAAAMACTTTAGLAAEPLLSCAAPAHAFVFSLQDEHHGTMSRGEASCRFQVRDIADARPTPAMAIALVTFDTRACAEAFNPAGYMRVIPRAGTHHGVVLALRGLDPFDCALSAGSAERLVAYLDRTQPRPAAGGR